MADFTLKAGDTLRADAVYRDADGNAVDLSAAGITITSAVRSPDGRQRFPLEVTLDDQAVNPGRFTLRGNSASWPVGSLLAWDIRYRVGGDSFSSRTITLNLLEAVTL